MEGSIKKSNTMMNRKSSVLSLPSMSKTVGGQQRASVSQLSGQLIVHVLEAEKIQVPEGISLGESSNIRPFVRLTLGKTTFDTGIAVGSYLHMWRNSTYTFPVVGASVLNCVLYHKPQDTTADPIPIGTVSIPVKSKTECGQKWLKLFKLQSEPSNLEDTTNSDDAGQIKLRWDFNSQTPDADAIADTELNSAAAAEDESEPLGKLKLEIVRAKNLVMPEYWISFSPFVTLEYQGTSYSTKSMKNTTNPFYNHHLEIDVWKDEPLVFNLMDANDGASGDGSPRQYACYGYTFNCDASIKQKNETLDLQEHLDTIEPTQPLGQLSIRLSFDRLRQHQVPESKQPEPEGDEIIKLGYEPKISGSVAIVPADCHYVWFNVCGDSKYKMLLEQRVIESYLADHLKQQAPPGRLRPSRTSLMGTLHEKKEIIPLTIDSVIKTQWKLTRMRPIIDMCRLCAERILGLQPLPAPSDEVQNIRVKYTEMALMREQVMRDSSGARSSITGLWEMFTTGNTTPSDRPDSPSESDEEKDVQPEFEEIDYKAILYHYLLTFVPGISQEFSKEIAEAEWLQEGSSGRDREGNLLLKEERFSQLIIFITSLWGDTLTEYEAIQFLSALTPVIAEARKTAIRWKKSGRRKTKHKVYREGFKRPDHLDELGHRIRQGTGGSIVQRKQSLARKQSTKSSSRSVNVAPPSDQPPSRASPRGSIEDTSPSSSIQSDVPIFGDFANATDPPKKPPTHTARRSTGGKRRSTINKKGSMRSLGSIRKKKKTDFEIAEDKVSKAFELEDMDWNVVAAWVKEVFGGFGEHAMDLLNMGPSEVDMLITRLFSDDYPSKHPKVKSDIVTAVVDFFRQIRPQKPPPEEVAPQEEGEFSSEVLKGILNYASMPVLRKLMVTTKHTNIATEPVLIDRMVRLYAVPEASQLQATLLQIFSEETCEELRIQVSLGKLKSPPKLTQVVAEMACTLLGITTNGYWAKFRESLAKPGSHSHFQKFNPSSMNQEKFDICLKMKVDSDEGRDRQGRQLPTNMLGVSWVTMTESTILNASTKEMVALYKWVKLIMMAFSRHSGRSVDFIEAFGWTDRQHAPLYWD
eukprot:TRINITY_DN8489_c0_g1_i1.p1 TRINITY_DN8489_c0_g1~~TRINITY_DN8489_c0_g1_i1.p1  ORF type:complete len:1088 (+),score=181.29 TRINITY_DN8489_c0_g1_i1:63-3326(+)